MTDHVIWLLVMGVNFLVGVVSGATWITRRLVVKTHAMNLGCEDVEDCLHVHLSEKTIYRG